MEVHHRLPSVQEMDRIDTRAGATERRLVLGAASTLLGQDARTTLDGGEAGVEVEGAHERLLDVAAGPVWLRGGAPVVRSAMEGCSPLGHRKAPRPKGSGWQSGPKARTATLSTLKSASSDWRGKLSPTASPPRGTQLVTRGAA